MSINITLIFAVLIIFFMGTKGYRRGMAKEISGLISWIITLFVMSLIIMLFSSVLSNQARNTIYSALILILVGLIYGLVRLVFKSVKLISRLPVFNALNRILGFVVGMGEGILIIWLIYVINETGVFGSIGHMIYRDTSNSVILSLLYQYNYLARLVTIF